MNDADAMVRKLLRQQAAIAGFGSFALRQSDLMKVLMEAAKVCARYRGASRSSRSRAAGTGISSS